MASETIFAYVGPKGSGKTHEGTRVVLEQLRLGRYVVAVIPTLSVQKVAEYLKDDSVYHRLVVCDYDAVDRDDFFPHEGRVRFDDGKTNVLGLEKRKPRAKRTAIRMGDDAVMFVGPPEEIEDEEDATFSPMAWRESVVPCGAVVVIDEAWRWLENTSSIPKRFKKALHMARHWRGPADWREADDRARYTREEDPWHPGLGGAVEKGGDGTELVSMNILLLTQDYSSLNRTLRKQVDQICDIKSYKKGAVPPIIQKLFPKWKTDGRYSVSTFEGHKLPDRRSKAYQTERKAFEILPHQPEIHGLFEYAGGQALERAVDDRSSASNDTRLGYIKYVAMLTVVAIIVFGYMTYNKVSAMISPDEEEVIVEASDTASAPVAAAPSTTVPYPSTTAPVPTSDPVARTAGVVAGTVMVIGRDGNLRPTSQPAIFHEDGFDGFADDLQVGRWSAPIGGSNSRAVPRTQLGVSGPGAGIGAAAVGFPDPNAVGASRYRPDGS